MSDIVSDKRKDILSDYKNMNYRNNYRNKNGGIMQKMSELVADLYCRIFKNYVGIYGGNIMSQKAEKCHENFMSLKVEKCP